MESKSGPITRDELMVVWASVSDPAYRQAFEDVPEGHIEFYEQAAEQLSRASEAVDVTTQAMYISPWSGQSNPSALGAKKATVVLEFSRSRMLDKPLVFGTELFVEHVAIDWGVSGRVEVHTGRLYRLKAPLVFNPGEAGPLTAEAEAIGPGWGYNNPLPGTINSVIQPGAAFGNTDAAVSKYRLVAPNKADMPVPEHVGQYVLFTAGPNMGRMARAFGYDGPKPNMNVGGELLLERTAVMEGTLTGSFAENEEVVLEDRSTTPTTVLATGQVIKVTGENPYTIVSWKQKDGKVADGADIYLVGVASATELTVDVVSVDPTLDDSSANSWQMVRWVEDWGLTVTNPQSPTGGRLGFLDELGKERKVNRAPGEEDGSYVERVSQVADTVSPAAIRRAVNRILSPYGLQGCLREVGQELLPGFFFDHDAFDREDIEARFKLWLNYTDFRGFFLIGVPPLNWGEFGFAYDNFPANAYDASVAYDGFPAVAAKLYQSVWQAVDQIRAGGVGFDLYVERFGCF